MFKEEGARCGSKSGLECAMFQGSGGYYTHNFFQPNTSKRAKGTWLPWQHVTQLLQVQRAGTLYRLLHTFLTVEMFYEEER